MLRILMILFSFFLFFTKDVNAQNAWIIENFHVDIAVKNTGEIQVVETINVDFMDLEKHGIYRDIPYLYKNDSGEIYTEVKIKEVLQDENNASIQVNNNKSNIRIRIG